MITLQQKLEKFIFKFSEIQFFYLIKIIKTFLFMFKFLYFLMVFKYNIFRQRFK